MMIATMAVVPMWIKIYVGAPHVSATFHPVGTKSILPSRWSLTTGLHFTKTIP